MTRTRTTFKPGNPGKPKGAKNKITRVAEALLEGEAEALTRKAIDQALAGDTVALRLCLERIAPVRKDRAIAINMPTVTGVEDHPHAVASIMNAVASGEITPAEGQSLSAVLEQHRRAVETCEIDARLRALEAERGDS